MGFLDRPQLANGILGKVRRLLANSRDDLVLNDLLTQAPTASDLPEMLYWLEQLIQWLLSGGAHSVDTRFRYFHKRLDDNPEWKEQFSKIFDELLTRCDFFSLFTHVGFAVEHGLWGDLMARLTQKVVPAGGGTDFQSIVLNSFKSRDQSDQIGSLSEESLLRLDSLLYTSHNLDLWRKVGSESVQAIRFLLVHVGHYGLSSEVWSRLAEVKMEDISFMRLVREASLDDYPELLTMVDQCERDVENVYASLELHGVSVDVVNRLETISALLIQVRALIGVRTAASREDRVRGARQLFAAAAEAGIRGRSIIEYLRRHFYLLARKISERNGQSGEHYFARTPTELVELFRSSIGGGLIVVVMTVSKTWVLRAQMAPFYQAVGVSTIYATGFLAMQFLGCTLATKIPSFTASRLAELLIAVRKKDNGEFRSEFRVVIKSQLLALLGNLAGVIPFAICLNLILMRLGWEQGLMDEHYARHILHDLHPLFSFALGLGALTGLELWLSSLAGGWFENWLVFNQVPEGIANHYRLRRSFGLDTARRLAETLKKNASGVATNMALGLLFGFVPLLGSIVGFNWNGNHVTISTAGAMFAASSLHFSLGWEEWLFLGIGLALIGILNFAVSFGMALAVAGRAQNIKFLRMLRYLRMNAFKSPIET